MCLIAFYFVLSSICTTFKECRLHLNNKNKSQNIYLLFCIVFNLHYLCIMEIYFKGLFIALSTFLFFGVFHPVVIRTEYHFGTKPWWIFLVLGVASICSALFVADVFWSALLGVLGASFLWSIGELFEQKQRVKKGWFPMNPKRKDDYK